MSRFEVIVLGLGAMGSSALCHLARRDAKVVGIDAYQPPHSQGSSHGHSRIIREAYFEDPLYVPLVQRAYELWQDLERESGKQLLVSTGGVMIGPSDGILVDGARRSAELHGLHHEVLSSGQITQRFPVLSPQEGMVGVFERRAGVLSPELCVGAHLDLARRFGAELRFNDAAIEWEAGGQGVAVVTASGERFSADRLIVASGAWTGPLMPDLELPLKVERQVMFWFEPTSDAERFGMTSCPIYILEYAAKRWFYGFPDSGQGVKVAIFGDGDITDPDRIQRTVTSEDEAAMREILEVYVPTANGKLLDATVCMFTNTPDGHFILDRHPGHDRVLIASPCSGHGFKFSSVIGELLAQSALGQEPAFDLSLFGIDRF